MAENLSYISLGSNQGNRETHLQSAIEELNQHSEIKVLKVSPIYETEPIGNTAQSSFLNMVIQTETTLTPLKLLETTQRIENIGGRERTEKWGPRTIDLDILLYNEENIVLEKLEIPHPRLFERGFVLIPLKDIAPDLRFKDGQAIDYYLHQLTDKEGVRIWKSSFGGDESEHFEN
ncbi:2-amino-4-hydroxy-6-hydroxymethyldihydropteridine diphosphokinase [Salipaludibacillus sp. CF4.18]|uniref:2-amino-4-hydroxy-6- hydroxymethyldihydropteridine diphosphokinase n=1 Tax=Salipaludibacillus sp. CF4.18 TaxID=3373081 RepID=UPI003EE51093